MLRDKDTEFKPGLSSIKTGDIDDPQTNKGSLNLTASTKVYVITGTRTGDGEYANDTDPYTDNDPGEFQEATDNKVKVYDYSDFDQNTLAGNAILDEIATEAASASGRTYTASTTSVADVIRFVSDKTTATAVVIDNRGWNLGIATLAAAKKLGAVEAAGDIEGGQVFKSAKTETTYLGVATGTEYKLNSDGVTEQLASLTVLTKDGEVKLDTFKDKLDKNQDAKGKIVIAKLDATGKVQAVDEGANDSVNAPEVDKVSFGPKQPSTSTTTLTTVLNGTTYNIKTDTNCLVVKFNGSSYTESTIGDINRDTDYVGVKFMTSQLNGTDAKATVILAVKDSDVLDNLDFALTAFSVAAAALAENTTEADNVALKGAADAAKTDANTAIATYEAAYDADFDMDEATAAEAAQYTEDAQAIEDYETAAPVVTALNLTAITPASLAHADIDTVAELQAAIVAKINNALITADEVDLSGLALKAADGETAGTGVATDQWIGTVKIVKSGCAKEIAVAAGEMVLT